jgi:hypothetical protein
MTVVLNQRRECHWNFVSRKTTKQKTNKNQFVIWQREVFDCNFTAPLDIRAVS